MFLVVRNFLMFAASWINIFSRRCYALSLRGDARGMGFLSGAKATRQWQDWIIEQGCAADERS